MTSFLPAVCLTFVHMSQATDESPTLNAGVGGLRQNVTKVHEMYSSLKLDSEGLRARGH
jgi:hypothetical protein